MTLNPHGCGHRARSFGGLPDSDAARSLLAELATAPCELSAILPDLPVALYGAGNLGRLARGFLQTVGIDLTMVIDRDARRIAADPEWSGVRMLIPDEVTDREKNEVLVAVSLANSPYVPVERALLDLGFKYVVPFYDLAERFRHVHPLSNGWFAPPLSAKDQQKTEQALALWDDDISRAHHLQFLAWRRLREEWTFEGAPVSNSNRFFIPEVVDALGDQEIFVDAGAHLGSVAEAFMQKTGGAFRQIIAIEPDPASRAALVGKLTSLLPEDPRISVLDCALGERDGEAVFHHGLGYASQLSQTGSMRVVVRPIDALELAPTFVKLHLEGAELAALKGARRTLLAHRPVIAATVYHNHDGIWKTADWLMETLPRYGFLFRVHSWCGTGAVIYAIPSERQA